MDKFYQSNEIKCRQNGTLKKKQKTAVTKTKKQLYDERLASGAGAS